MSRITDLTFMDVHEPDYSHIDLWIGRTATKDCSVEIDISGILYMQSESLGVTLNKDDARKLANAILEHLDSM